MHVLTLIRGRVVWWGGSRGTAVPIPLLSVRPIKQQIFQVYLFSI